MNLTEEQIINEGWKKVDGGAGNSYTKEDMRLILGSGFNVLIQKAGKTRFFGTIETFEKFQVIINSFSNNNLN